MRVLTAEFGMGSGVSLSLLPPENLMYRHFVSYKLESALEDGSKKMKSSLWTD